MPYPKRLIEVDLPIKQISKHARREKSIRHGHISTLHIWWARRPLAACRAVICAALWPDPADDLCPQSFRDEAAHILADFAEQVRADADLAGLVADHWNRWHRTNIQSFSHSVRSPQSGSGSVRSPQSGSGSVRSPQSGSPKSGLKDSGLSDSALYGDMRYALLDFIADFANWDASTVPAFLETARALTQAAHQALGGLPGTRPLVVDPFAGGGAIPLEALRVGADAFASDLNPVAVLLNKVVLEYIPKYGNAKFRMQNADGDDIVLHGLAEAVRYWGQWIKEQAEKELAEFYPPDPDGATPIAYLWARTIISEAPDVGSDAPVEVPLMRSLWLAKKKGKFKALRWVRDATGRVQTETVDVTYADGVTRTVRRPLLEMFEPKKRSEVEEGTVARGSATCPVTGYTTPVKSVRRQLKPRRGGAADARLFAVVTTPPGERGRSYRLPTERDWDATRAAAEKLEQRKAAHTGPLSLVPDEEAPPHGALSCRNALYGLEIWSDFFTARQALILTSITELIRNMPIKSPKNSHRHSLAVQTCLALAVSRLADRGSTLCRWDPSPTASGIINTFSRQALPMMWDFAEGNPFEQKSGGWLPSLEWIALVADRNEQLITTGQTEIASATNHPLPNDIAQIFLTDPPYYNAINYANISDFFYVWLKRAVGHLHKNLFSANLTNKNEECVVNPVRDTDSKFYENMMQQAMAEGCRILNPTAVGIVVFAHKSTAGWEAQLQAMVDAGWIITGSWPIDTEMGTRMNAMGTAALASSIHLICRPRENANGSLNSAAIGDWRDVLRELPERIHDWLPRLAREGVVGADAIFACLGPALEIYSRYSRVEKASGEAVPLGEYLEYVWAAVSKEALGMVFAGADASGFEEDARLTAMWLWTLNDSPESFSQSARSQSASTSDIQTSDFGQEVIKSSGYTLEYDAARKIAQGLGAHLENLDHLVQIKGSKARLLPSAERADHLFGKEGVEAVNGGARPKSRQMSLFEANAEGTTRNADWNFDDSAIRNPQSAFTTLDRVHQSMLLFAAGRSEALRRFLIDDGVGRDARYWALANALSALYPPATDEKRWVDGVLARKKGLGF